MASHNQLINFSLITRGKRESVYKTLKIQEKNKFNSSWFFLLQSPREADFTEKLKTVASFTMVTKNHNIENWKATKKWKGNNNYFI